MLNTPPADLDEEELFRLRTWLERMQSDDLFLFFQYLDHHGIARDVIFQGEFGTVRLAWRGMAAVEIDRLRSKDESEWATTFAFAKRQGQSINPKCIRSHEAFVFHLRVSKSYKCHINNQMNVQ